MLIVAARIRAHLETYRATYRQQTGRHLSIEALADRLGLESSYVGRVLGKTRGDKPSVRLLLAMRDLLHRSADYLLDEDPEPQPRPPAALGRVRPPSPDGGRST